MARETRKRTLYRDPKHALLGGVCAGIAERLDVDIVLVRVAAIVALIMTCGIAALMYLVLWTTLPVKVSQGTFIEVVPLRVQSERYDTVVASGFPGSIPEQDDTTSARDRQRAFDPRRARRDLAAYRPALFLFVAFIIVITVISAVVASSSPSTDFSDLIPLYFIPLGIFLMTIPKTDRSIAIRICIMVLCFEACMLFLPFTLGIVTYESLGSFGPSTFITWLIALVFLLAAIIFENTACYLFAVMLIFMAITVSFYDFGFFDSMIASTRS